MNIFRAKIVKIYEQEGRIYFLNIATGLTNLRTVKLKKNINSEAG